MYGLTSYPGAGATIGAGVYILVGREAREHTGPSLALSFFICGIAAALPAFCYAELAYHCPSAGCAYHFSFVCIGEGCASIEMLVFIHHLQIAASSPAIVVSSPAKHLESLLPFDHKSIHHSPPQL
nr:Cationic amino acid transporter 2, vacuolar [Ipomoea trifida]